MHAIQKNRIFYHQPNEPPMTALKKILYSLLLCTLASQAFAQNDDFALADEYFAQGEYQKARDSYERLLKNVQNWKTVHQNYMTCLLQLRDWKAAEKHLARLRKLEPENLLLAVESGKLSELQGDNKSAQREYDKLIQAEKQKPQRLIQLYLAFLRFEKLDWAEKTILAARKQESSKTAYAAYLADLYARQGNKSAMIEEYLNLVLEEPMQSKELVQNALQDQLQEEEDLKMLENVLIKKIQENPNEKVVADLIVWLYVQQKRFDRAFIQARAIDKRFKLSGTEVFELGFIAFENKDYPASSKIFDYLVKEYPKSFNYITARTYLIKSKEEMIKNSFPVDKEQVRSVMEDYEKVLKEIGRSNSTIEIMESKALLMAFYLDEKDEALLLLQEAIDLARYNNKFIAKCKTSMGDIYLLKGEPWEATLLYSQAEKLQKDSPIAYEAKLKNAKLNYYKGDFELAQSHLDILKMATSREIANDAMELSLLIKDNLMLDTLGTALKEYARIDLLLFQNKVDEALQALDKMLQDYPNHSLSDDIYYLKAQVYIRLGAYEKALDFLKKIVFEYKYDLKTDDAHFLMGKLYEEKLNNKDKAMEIYQNHLSKYPGSIYVAEARKRFRMLRGDQLK